jgi:hypothetical protein
MRFDDEEDVLHLGLVVIQKRQYRRLDGILLRWIPTPAVGTRLFDRFVNFESQLLILIQNTMSIPRSWYLCLVEYRNI